MRFKRLLRSLRLFQIVDSISKPASMSPDSSPQAIFSCLLGEKSPVSGRGIGLVLCLMLVPVTSL